MKMKMTEGGRGKERGEWEAVSGLSDEFETFRVVRDVRVEWTVGSGFESKYKVKAEVEWGDGFLPTAAWHEALPVCWLAGSRQTRRRPRPRA